MTPLVDGALACAYLSTPWAGRPVEQYRTAGALLVIGVVLPGVTVPVDSCAGATERPDPESLQDRRTERPDRGRVPGRLSFAL
ncbi:hypothetical protein [Klenkia marina]|uniref:hypothetical protein n=1 Tax=Klenkia marina TaxID=1960309 RepID=UPI0010594160|nr:hypothetical protein [Klenkia marina]